MSNIIGHSKQTMASDDDKTTLFFIFDKINIRYIITKKLKQTTGSIRRYIFSHNEKIYILYRKKYTVR